MFPQSLGVNLLRDSNIAQLMSDCVRTYKAKLRMLSDKFDDPGGDPGGEESITGSLVSFRKMPSEDQVMIFMMYSSIIYKVISEPFSRVRLILAEGSN